MYVGDERGAVLWNFCSVLSIRRNRRSSVIHRTGKFVPRGRFWHDGGTVRLFHLAQGNIMIKALYLLNSDAYERIYGPDERADLAALLDTSAPLQTAASVQQDPSVLADVEVLLSGWGCPVLDANLLAKMPLLKGVFYGAGSIRGVVTPAFWERTIPITSSYAANAVPVAEYTLAQIILCLKRAWQQVFAIRSRHDYVRSMTVPGAYGSTVGIISLGMIGRLVARRLQELDVCVVAYDPFVEPDSAADLGVELCSLEDVFRRADVVSLHTPWLPQTEGMIGGAHFAMMKEGASFINTARGAVVREHEMLNVLKIRRDLFAVLDVVWPEPPADDSPIFDMENVILTPHIAGSLGDECRRMGRIVVEEVNRFLHGEPLHWAISRERAEIMA